MKFSIFVIKMAFYQTVFFEREVNASNYISTFKHFFLNMIFLFISIGEHTNMIPEIKNSRYTLYIFLLL